MIAHERNSPYPFAASKTPVESPRTAYEILKLELMIFVDMYFDRTGRVPSSDELQFDACRIVFTAELPAYGHDEAEEGYSSWLRDLVLSSDSVVRRARLNPLRPAIESRLSFIGVIGKKTPFESCPFEAQLASYVEERRQEAYPNELFLTHQELQAEACRIMRVADKNCVSAAQSDIPTTWLENLAQSSTEWLDGFCARYGLPMTTPSTSLDTTPVDSFLDNYNRLSENLVARLEARDADPTDAQLRQQMLLCILECDASPEWKAAAVSSHSWLARFKRRNFPWSEMYLPPGDDEAVASAPTSPPSLEYRQHSSLAGMSNSNPGATVVDWAPKSSYFLNDPNFDRSVPRELARWVAATMSPNNPNQHVPTDLEVQNQARWIMFGE